MPLPPSKKPKVKIAAKKRPSIGLRKKFETLGKDRRWTCPKCKTIHLNYSHTNCRNPECEYGPEPYVFVNRKPKRSKKKVTRNQVKPKRKKKRA